MPVPQRLQPDTLTCSTCHRGESRMTGSFSLAVLQAKENSSPTASSWEGGHELKLVFYGGKKVRDFEPVQVEDQPELLKS